MSAAGYRRWAWAGGVLALALLAPLINLTHLRGEILVAIQDSLGRRAAATGVHLVLLPLPGIELDGLRIADDPAFGYEDAIYAQSARATLRWSALLTGRLSFSRIHLDGASINVVRSARGEWNFARLGPARQVGAAGAGGAAAAAPTPFPYLDWANTRVNFKLDQGKTRFYLDQVQGSLAREQGNWRVQAEFVPARSDLTITDVGVVSIDGRYSAAPAPMVFDLAVRLRDSYLAGSSALIWGHDAGLHGILNLQARVHGDARRIDAEVSLAAQSLRRWDLLPPPAGIHGVATLAYLPAEDRLLVSDAGDPGLSHIRMAGELQGLFGSPVLHLTADVNRLPATELVPVAAAVKANLPQDLRATGTASGHASLTWDGRAGWRGDMRMALQDGELASGASRLSLPSASLSWHESRLESQTEAVVHAGKADGVAVQLGAQADARGFSLSLAAHALTAPAAAALAQVFGMEAFWPAAIDGSADTHLRLQAAWPEYRKPHWSGRAVWGAATAFAPPDDAAPIPLTRLTAALADPQPRHFEFTAQVGDDPVRGTVDIPVPGPAPAPFSLTAAHLDAAAVWNLLQPPPSDLVDRVLGRLAPRWLTAFKGQGRVRIADLDWRGVHTAVDATLTAGDGWQASPLHLRLAHGRFDGFAQLRAGRYLVQGEAGGLDLAELLAASDWRDMASGRLGGRLHIARAPGGGWSDMEGGGDFVLTAGALRAPAPALTAFDRFTAAFQFAGGTAQLSQVVFRTPAAEYSGDGVLRFDRDFALDLAGSGGALHLRGVAAAPPSVQAPEMERDLALAKRNSAAADGPWTDVTFSAAAANQWFAQPGKLPAGVSHLTVALHQGVLTATAQVDFDQLGTRPSNPLLAMFAGAHTVAAEARLAAGDAPAAQVEITRVSLDGQVVPNALVDAAVRVFVQPRYPELGRRFAVPLPAHAARVEAGENQLRLVYPR